jgi:hypothetical protein
MPVIKHGRFPPKKQARAMTGRYVNGSDDPLRSLSDQVGEQTAAAMAGKPAAVVVPLKPRRAGA